jgi:chemotaxis protein CheX
MMGKETVWQRRARKRGAAKGDYYPKVDLSDEPGADALTQIEALSPIEAAEKQGQAPASAEAPAAPLEMAASAEPALEAEPISEADATVVETEEPASDPIEAVEATAVSGAEDAIRLPEFLDLAAATPLAKVLVERRGKPIVIDGSAVHQLGAQCVQVLLSARKTWIADGVPLSFVNCAPRMIEDLQYLGIDSATLNSGELAQ